MEGWSLNILAQLGGRSLCHLQSEFVPGLVDNVQWRDNFNVDMRLMKTLSLYGFDVQLYVDVQNVFNFKFLNYAGFADSYDYQDYLASLCFAWMEGDKKGDDRIGEYRPDDVAYDPLEANPNNDPAISARNQERKDKKSYIDMPNITSLTYLSPRNWVFGVSTCSF